MLAGLMIACTVLLGFLEHSLKHSIFAGVDGEARIAANGIESFVSEGLAASKVIASTVPANALVQRRTGDIEADLRQMQERFPKFQRGLFVLDASGAYVAGYPPSADLGAQSWNVQNAFQRTGQSGHGVVTDPYRVGPAGSPILTFTAPIKDEQGQIVGVLGCAVDLLSREALGGYRTQSFGTTGYLYIFNKSRLLVLHPDDRRLLTFVEAGRNRELEAALNGFEGTDETVNSYGVPMLAAVRQVANTGWMVAVQLPQQEAYAPLVQAQNVVIVIGVFALCVAIVVGAILIRHITGPLQQLEGAASHIAAELERATTSTDYTVTASTLSGLKTIRSKDEIGLLAASFLRLTTTLTHALGSLQRSAADWNRTFNAVNEAVITLDLDCQIVQMNDTAESWLDLSIDEARGRPAANVIFRTTSLPKEWPDVTALAEHQRVRWSQKMDQPRAIWEFNVTAIAGPTGNTGAVLVINDITQRVESEEHIREIAKAFKIAERTLNILVKGFDEDTPLSVARIIYEETGVGAVAITDTEKLLAFVGTGSDHHLPGVPVASEVTLRAIRENQVIFADGVHDYYDCPMREACPLGSALVVPLVVDNDVVGTIKLYEPRNKTFLNINKSLGEGITRLLSNQLLLSRFQQQKNLLVLSELKLLHAQINPHFLFNALNTIIAILRTDAARARELLIDLSNFFRKNLKRKSDFSSLEEELEHVNSYLEIEKARFEDRLVVNMNIDPALLQMRMPAFTLQPLIENAIKHGISQLLAQGVVSIRAYYEDRVAIIEIEDNAGAYDEGKHSKDGLGIKLVNKRIRSLFGTDFGTSVACVRDEITRVTLRLPLEATRALEVTAQ
jgi:two-component system LytT family sensor kinase